MTNTKTSLISKFYKRTIPERREELAEWVTSEDLKALDSGLTLEQADSMVENVVTVHGLPFGIATNFQVNQRDYLVPMVVEEPSVIAAASNAAKMFRAGGGFFAESDEPVMIGQIQVLDIPDMEQAIAALKDAESALLAKVDEISGSIVRRGGGARGLELRVFPETEVGPMLIVHLLMDTRDAMGANAINTAVEFIAADVAELTRGRTHLRILSNLTDRRKVRAWGTVPVSELATAERSGHDVARLMVEASVFAEVDPYRATTHNKGVMNGIDAVVLATGNDWRAVEAGAHAFVAHGGSYTSLTKFRQNDAGDLECRLELPLAVGTVGGATRVHPLAQFSLKLMGIESARQLAEVVAAVGLAQNFAAVRALSTTGIQHGHMRLHAKQLALAAGASPQDVPVIVEQMLADNVIRLERAISLVRILKERNTPS
jgi:hydroxymethylglutaryl-CoA reductase